jgi:hypothetical protein
MLNQNAKRAGFVLGVFSNPVFKNNTFQDIFSWGNGAYGLAAGPWGTGSVNNSLIRATVVNNGQASDTLWKNIDTDSATLTRFNTVSDLKIGNPAQTGGGARLQYQYVNGTLGNTPLWPWPMEDRIKTEFADPSLFQADGVAGRVWNNFSVTGIITSILQQYGALP